MTFKEFEYENIPTIRNRYYYYDNNGDLQGFNFHITNGNDPYPIGTECIKITQIKGDNKYELEKYPTKMKMYTNGKLERDLIFGIDTETNKYGAYDLLTHNFFEDVNQDDFIDNYNAWLYKWYLKIKNR